MESNNNMLDRLLERFPEDHLMIADGFDEAVLGVCECSHRVIYSSSKCIAILTQEGMSEEDAIEHFYYNVCGAYVGERTPIWCNDFS